MTKKKFERPQLKNVEELSEELVLTSLKLSQANQRLREEQAARNDMFTSISHDLRSPLTAIKNAVELLSSMEECSSEKVSSLLKMMAGRIDTLEHLINDIFLLVSLDNNCAKMDLKPIQLGFFLEDFFFSREEDSLYKDRNLELLVPEDLDVYVNMDPAQMERVLDNLFTNAYKYSDKDATISLDATLKDNEVIISVKDTGIGIAKENIEKVFERCFIVETARTPGVSSTGFGLAITKSIIEHFNGKIWCESTLGEGSCFYISLPCEGKE